MIKLLDIYHRLPHPLRWGVANLRGLQLRRRRYGSTFWSMLPAIRERNGWDRNRWEAWQLRQLVTLLEVAAKHVSAYQGIGTGPKTEKDPSIPVASPGCGKAALDLLSRWPLLDRRWCREHPEELLDRRKGRRRLSRVQTSGTTGSPQLVYRDAEADQAVYAYFEARCRNPAGVNVKDRWAMIGGQLVVPFARRRPPFWIANWPMRQLYLSSYHMHEGNGRAYLDAIERFEPVYIHGYASSLHWLAQQADKLQSRLTLKLAISNAEPLYAHQRSLISRALGCEVRDAYGSAEGVALAFECGAGRMHVSPDFGIVEILRADGSHCSPGEVGHIAATGLTNWSMILIRYLTGDSAAWAEDQLCPCGCTFPILEQIEGRTDDLLETAEGRMVGRLDPVFKADCPIREAQVIQHRDLSIEIRVVPEPGFDTRQEKDLVREMQARMGEGLPITVSRVREIPRTASGKFRAVVRER